jgi:hypothetical protein
MTTSTDIDGCRKPHCRTRPQPGYAPRGLCPPDEAAGLDAIHRLPDDHANLQPLVWDKPQAGIGTVGSPFGPTVPVNLGADELANEIAYTAVVWEIAVRDRARLSDAPDLGARAIATDLRRAACILAAHYSALLALPPTDFMGYDEKPATMDGVEAVLALTGLHRRASVMLGIASPTARVPGLCGECDAADLYHRDGSDKVTCGTCKAWWYWDTYQDGIALVPVDEAA